MDAEDISNGDSAEATLFTLGLTMGYFWRWSTFNIHLAGGIQKLSVSDLKTDSASTSQDVNDLEGLLPKIDFQLGWAF